jgi:hypothetical protein
MPLFKVGTTTNQNGEVQQVYMMQGNAVRDAETKEINAKQMAKVSIAAAEKDGATVFVTLQGWRYKAADVARIKKMDSVLAFGVLKSRTYNERTYWEMDADFVTVSGVKPSINFAGHAPVSAGDFNDSDAGEFAPIDDEDCELPF